VLAALILAAGLPAPQAPPPSTCSILVYHRFAPAVADSMTTTTAVFEQQVGAMRLHGYRIVPLAGLMDVLRHRVPASGHLVAITVDDGHRSVYSELLPALRRLDIPVTLFIYPSAIGHAAYALTWEQLRELAADPQVEIGAHTYWHPDFRLERRRLAPPDYVEFVAMQLSRPRAVLQQELGIQARFLAWPYGIVDDELQRQAQASGYSAAFALGNRNIASTEPLFAVPRHLIVDAVGVRGLLARLATAPACQP
jgi:peptidoglycan/xylan/chitin deacetylase (PgdA/CDA1 family)